MDEYAMMSSYSFFYGLSDRNEYIPHFMEVLVV